MTPAGESGGRGRKATATIQEAAMTTVEDRVQAWMTTDLARWQSEQNPPLSRPRKPLLDEMIDAYRNAHAAITENTRSYWLGVGLGYLVGFGWHPRTPLDNARLVPHATNLHIDFWKPNRSADTTTFQATGIRYGYLLATSERPDAIDCDLCGERLTDDDEQDSCEHGRYCEGGCIRDFHGADMRLGDCDYRDGE